MGHREFFEGLRPFVWPKYREEGPPEFVQAVLIGRNLLGEKTDLSISARTVLELMTFGYRPATTLAILDILSEGPGLALHGMQIARELENLFQVQEGWFTRARYYTDRVGKLLRVLVALEIL